MPTLLRSLTVFLFIVLTAIFNWNCSDADINSSHVSNNQQIDGNGDNPTFTLTLFVIQDIEGGTCGGLSHVVLNESRTFNTYNIYSDWESFTTLPTPRTCSSSFDVYYSVSWSNLPVWWQPGAIFYFGDYVKGLNCPPVSGFKERLLDNVNFLPNTEYSWRLGTAGTYVAED